MPLALLLTLAAGVLADGVGSLPLAPEPNPAYTGRYLVGAQMCPIWGSPERWAPIRAYPEREPVLGWYAEGSPEVTDWEITYALDHGISFLLVCWYRARDNLGRSPIESLFPAWLEEGLPGSRFGDRFRYALMWENANQAASSVASESDLLDNLVPWWIERHFGDPHYLRVDGRPLFAIYSVERLVEDLGGEEVARQAIGRMRAAVREAGLGELLLLGQHCWGGPEETVRLIRSLGLDYCFAYHLPTFRAPYHARFAEEPSPPPEWIVRSMAESWSLPEDFPSIPTVSMGWDARPWGEGEGRPRWQLTPSQFQDALTRARARLDASPRGGLDGRMVLLDNWNEYGEGHWLFPTRGTGFGYLEAVRGVFAANAGVHGDVVPP